MSIDLTQLHKDLQPLAIQFISRCHDVGLTVRITQGFRSPETQQALFDQGLSHARPEDDPHCALDEDKNPASQAFDYSCFDKDMKYITDGTDSAYRQAGIIGEGLGLSWGGRWGKPDWDHLNLKSWVWGQSKAFQSVFGSDAG